MRIPIPPRAERALRSYSIPVFAVLHLGGFHLIRIGVLPHSLAGKWIASAVLGAAILLARELVPSRRLSHLPDFRFAMSWAASALLQLHSLVPGMAESRIVPAVLFPVLPCLLAPGTAGVYAVVSLAWFSWIPGSPPGLNGLTVSMTAMAALGLSAGFWIRNRLRGRPDRKEPGGGARVDEAESLMIPWQNPGREQDFAFETPQGRERILQMHEIRTAEGVRRVLEGILPASGADRVLFVTRSEDPGRPFLVRHEVRKSGGDSGAASFIPDSYVPLREAMVFRRTFFSEGEEAERWGLSCGGRMERPSGVAAAPVLHEGIEEGAILAFRFGGAGWGEPVVPLLETGAFLIAREVAEGRSRYRSDRTLAAWAGYHRFFNRVAELAERKGVVEPAGASPRREIYRVTAEAVRESLRADRVLLVEGDKKGTRGRIVWEEKRGEAPPAPDREYGEEGWVRLGGTYAAWVLEKGVHRIFAGGSGGGGRHPVLPAQWSGVEKDHLLVPVSGPDGFRGLLVCASPAGRNFHGMDAEAARELLRIMRMGISHSRFIETLEEQATTDGLTGLINRKTFSTRLSSVLSRLDGRYPCTVIMLDIDHFKRVNDTYGHPAGDEVLRNVASIIRKTIRKIDMAGRFGGEEFVLYLHHADRERAENVAERLRMIIGKARYTFDGKETGVTASLGAACYPADGRTLQELVGKADEALYRSKQGGRNRLTFS